MLDTIRGVCILGMILFHILYDVKNMWGIPTPWNDGPMAYALRAVNRWGFVLVSGFCWGMSRSHVKRGAFLLGCGLLITVITYLAMPSQLIVYGILWFMGLATLCLHLLRELWRRLPGRPAFPAPAGFLVSLFLFFLSDQVPRGALGFESLRLWELPAGLYQFPGLAMLGLPGPAFHSTDYFPLLPWFFLYSAGYFLWRLAGPCQPLMDKLRPGFAPLSFLGRHSLLIYLLHQPLIMVIFMALQGG